MKYRRVFICSTYPSTIIQHATATPARHCEMLSRAHDTAKRNRQSASTCEAHPMRGLIAPVSVR
eukprot:1735695-Prymnesium_polylepis.1